MTAAIGLFDRRNVNLLRELTVSQYKLKDQSTFFGLMWSFLNPLLMAAVLFLFFNRRFGVGIDHYGIYLLLGMVQYTHFANTTSTSMRALLTMKQLTRETVFPKELLVLSSTLSSTLDVAVAMLVCLLVAYATGVQPAWSQILLPAVVALQLLLAVWVSLVLACIFPFARDIDHIYQVFLRVLLFVTPIFYTASYLGDGTARSLVLFNPLAHLIELARRVVIEGQAPSASTAIALALVNVALVAASWRIFKVVEPRLAEYV